jgi:hypothetical protein
MLRPRLCLIAVVLVLATTPLTGCLAGRPPVPPIVDAALLAHRLQIAGECRDLWQDELGRAISDAELLECHRRRDLGATIEDWRAELRATAEYAAVHRPRLARLRVDGPRGFVDPTGRRFTWRGVTGFRLIALVAHGREADARAFLAWACGGGRRATIVRVLSALDAGLFTLTPADGLAALPRTLDLANGAGCYLEVVALAGTRAPAGGLSTRAAMGAHVEAVGAICARYAACAAVELANENSHGSQAADLVDVPFLRALRARVPASVPVSLGSTHGIEDESDIYQDGDYLTIHGDRADGDHGWRWIRHTNEQRALAERVRKFAVNDEPNRDDLAADKQTAIAVLCMLFGLGDTFHFAAGLQAAVPTGSEAAAFEARVRGWRLVPADWSGSYRNAGFVDSPVKGIAGAVRAYSSVAGDHGYTLILGADGERVEWNPDWPTRDLLLSDGGLRVYRVRR